MSLKVLVSVIRLSMKNLNNVLGGGFADLHALSLFLLVAKTPRDYCIVSVSSKTQ